jgi:hypothetical protein
MANDNTGRSTGDAAHSMMFSHPVTGEAKAFGKARKIGGVGKRGCDCAAFNYGD